jgi:hypothetical protein
VKANAGLASTVRCDWTWRVYKTRGLVEAYDLGLAHTCRANPKSFIMNVVRYEFHNLDRIIGGGSTSPAKVAAARANGLKCKKGMGGRPTSRTLIERILKRPVPPEEWKRIERHVLSLILLGHQQLVTDFFNCDWNEIPTRSWRGLPERVRLTIRHIKAATRIYLPKARPTKPPKDYVVIRVQKLPHEREQWARRYPDMPFVATRPRKIPMREIFNYAWFDRKFAQGAELDQDDVIRNGEGKITREVAVALLKYLKFKYAKP